MAARAGRHRLGPACGRLIVRTFRDGLAAQAGHDLTIEVTGWSADLAVNDDLSPAGLDVRIDLGSLVVREGTGGVKSLTDRDRREIAATAGKTLGTQRQPQANFRADAFEPGPDGGGVIAGTLSLAGATRPLRLRVSSTGPDSYRVTGSVVQSEFGIKPYTAFLGALRVRDAVEVEANVDLEKAAEAAA